MITATRTVQIIKPVPVVVLDSDNVPVTTKKRVAAYCRVSTDSEEQMLSYDAQVSEYRKKIEDTEDWQLIEIYADAGISGTNIKNRTAFNKMIADCRAGKIDLIITKSISRFARNTVDCLEQVRKLKLIGVEVFFEKENIYSFDSKMELVLTLLSSIAQEESRNISENTKWGIKKRMRDGKAMVNCKRFMGYDKDENGNLIINKKEAEIIKRIFREYVDGKGVASICKGLERDGIKTVSGRSKWYDSVVRKMLRNEKYYGELLLQKTVTLDYLTKYRVENNNHVDQYRVENNHIPIVSKEIWDLAQKECDRRCAIYSGENKDRSKYTKRYAFSGKLICGVCGVSYKRRHWNTGTQSAKIVWQCNNYIGKDIKTQKRCPAKTVYDKVLKDTFVRIYNEEFKDKDNFFRTFMKNIEKVIGDNNDKTPELEVKIKALESDLSELITLKLHKEVDEKAYGREYQRISGVITDLQMKKDDLVTENLENTKYISKLQAVKDIIGDGSKSLTDFDDALFEAMVAKVMIQSATEFEFIFESGQRVRVKAGK